MVLLCVAIYCATFLLLRAPGKASSFYAEAPHPQRLERGASLRLSGHAEQCSSLRLGALIGFLGLGVLAYTLDYFTASKSTQALMLLGTAALGLGAGVWSSWPTGKFRGSWMVPATFVCLLVVASLRQSETARAYEYRGNSRWTGPWDNPNTFGSLMGTGLILALAMGVGGLRMESRGWKRIVVSSSFLVAAFFLCRGLFNSYSRGAWLATACGGAYSLWHCISREMRGTRESHPVCSSRGDEVPCSKCGTGMRESESDRASSRRLPRLIERFHFSCVWRISRLTSGFRSNCLPVSILVLSAVVLTFWHIRQTEWHPARRALSVANANDFSWRNRVAAWEGTLQMIAEQPWLGVGWNQPEPMYENYYLLPRLEESAAIQMNDYLLLGTTLGIPALFCFGMYLSLSLSGGSGARC
ncbi:MAG: O-antigen ligase family protein [Verrucomicrobiota bacterium]